MCVAKKEFILCRNCPQRTNNKPSNIPNGYYYDEINGTTVLRECSCHITWRKERELEYKLEKSNLLSDYKFGDYKGSKSLEDVRALEFMANNFDKFKYKKMVYVCGSNGTQKTSMVQALGKELIKSGYTAYYTLMQELINNLMPDFSKDDDAAREAFLKKCREVDLLIIDEAWDKSKVTLYNSGYQIPFLDSFLRQRFELNKGSILFVSNRHPSEISTQGFGTSLQNFVTRNTQGSLLMFEDRYIENVNQIDRLSLFK